MDTAGNEKAILARLDQPESPLMQRVTRNNQILLHNYQAEVIKHCRCALEGCVRTFGIVLIPNQILYPKFCQEHRSEFRREFHLTLRSFDKLKTSQSQGPTPHPSRVQDSTLLPALN